ncbi:MAG: hypothetical protein ACYC3R_10720, partial [Thiomonas delicata]
MNVPILHGTKRKTPESLPRWRSYRAAHAADAKAQAAAGPLPVVTPAEPVSAQPNSSYSGKVRNSTN